MTSVLTRVALVIAFAVAAGWQVSARDLTITFKTTAASSSVECVASMPPTHKKATGVRRADPVKWKLDGHSCASFDPTLVVLKFDDNVVKSKTLTGVKDTTDSKVGWIDAQVTSTLGDAPDGSQHFYIITYKEKNAGDPEIDINNNPAPGSGRGRGRRGGRE